MPTDPTEHTDDSATRSADPTRIRVVVVHAADVVTALEARERSRRRTVLRATPPFTGRMRARLHDAAAAEDRDAAPADGDGTVAESVDPPHPEASSESGRESTEAVHIPPRDLVVDPPPYPDPDDTEDALRARDAYDIETHRSRHAAAVADWRDTVRGRIAETVPITIEGETTPRDQSRSRSDAADTRPRTHEVHVSALGTSPDDSADT
ncbi:hypothetical protein [Halopenitus malekzadehii]|uniref:hypothetical protein n=1 Tax=Halopenitus malekzadehii TaxID=1267564 RepID=UPI001FDECFE6|nr:hypothetical protein [Halopenitus malekzadehii]